VTLNESFRFSKYTDGGFFDTHQDAVNQDRHGRRSIMTVNIFLNSAFSGGETDFLYDNKILRTQAMPAAGRGAIFDQQIWHRGNKVTNGTKYMLRTDVML
jgi:predicted 2-oxoglutarate/Fe(II)-dependent dioxygenase YbiX